MFGGRISLNFKGQTKIKTTIGTITSALFIIGMTIKVLLDFQAVWEGQV